VISAVSGAAKEWNVDAYLVLRLSYMESGWQMNVVSLAGAIGAMQVMPKTAEQVISDFDVPAETGVQVSPTTRS
jgi:soluble lytic murein transglycosylase-like protein